MLRGWKINTTNMINTIEFIPSSRNPMCYLSSFSVPKTFAERCEIGQREISVL